MLPSATSRKGQPDADLQTVRYQSMLLSATCKNGQPDACLHPIQNLSATSREGQQDAGLQPVQNPEHPLVSYKQEELVRFWLTYCPTPRACSYQQQAGKASQMLTNMLCENQGMLLSATSRNGQLDADLQAVQPRTCSYQQQAGRASQMPTYMLFKTKSMLLSATSREGQPDANLHTVQNPEHALVRNK